MKREGRREGGREDGQGRTCLPPERRRGSLAPSTGPWERRREKGREGGREGW